jgi:hypothetical protein
MKTIRAIHEAALTAAEHAAQQAYDLHGDTGACGFGWVEVEIDGRSPRSKELQSIGWDKAYRSKTLMFWRPSNAMVQSVYIQEVGASAYAKTFNDLVPDSYGLKVIPCSRLD